MADVIYKYGPLYYGEEVHFRGEPLHVGFHVDGDLYLWCRNPPKGLEGRPGKARIVYTGEEYIGRYIGTQVDRTGLVFHVVEV